MESTKNNDLYNHIFDIKRKLTVFQTAFNFITFWFQFVQQEITDFLHKNGIKGVSLPVSFAADISTPLAALRSKKGGDPTVTNGRAHKIPLGVMEPLFIEWIRYGKNKECFLNVFF